MNIMHSSIDTEPEPASNVEQCQIAKFIAENGKVDDKAIFDSDWWTLAITKSAKNEIDVTYEKSWETVSAMELGTWHWWAVKILLITCNDKINKIYWTDIVENAITVARENLKEVDIDGKSEFIVSDGLNSVPEEVLAILNFSFACLPQVIFTLDKKLLPEDHFAHYVDPEKYNEQAFNRYWYWLIEKTIKEFRMKNSKASILYNFAWRISKDIIFALYESCWYTPEIVYNEMVEQCETTELWMFVDLEKTEPEALWEFYEDIEGKKIITAEMAENRRKGNLPVYHRMYVVKWVPKEKETINA